MKYENSCLLLSINRKIHKAGFFWNVFDNWRESIAIYDEKVIFQP